MRQDAVDRFDRVMSGLIQIEPSRSFELRFKSRLEEAYARRLEESALSRFCRNASSFVQDIRYALSYNAQIAVRTAASLMIIVATGSYFYYSSPSYPAAISVSGSVALVDGSGIPYKAIDMNDKLRAGMILDVTDGAQLDIGVSGKYTVRIKSGSRIKISHLTPKSGRGVASFKLVQGRVLIDVDHGFKGSRFIIDTDNVKATALGTKFSVESGAGKRQKTVVSVLQGKVEVKGLREYGRILVAKQGVNVGAGQKSEISIDGTPTAPQRLMEGEWAQLEELYSLGRKPRVMLMIRNTPDRAKQLLGPCAMIISDERPRQIPRTFEKAILKIGEAVRTNDKRKHLESLHMIEDIVRERPDPKYDVQFMLYVGAYYEYLSLHDEAVRTFLGIVEKYPDSSLASLAQCAAGIILEEKEGDSDYASKVYSDVLKKYPNSLEAIWVEDRLGIKKGIKRSE